MLPESRNINYAAAGDHGRFLKYDPTDEHILRRLGAALVVQWDALSEPQQKIILDQATMMADRVETVQLRQQIEIFIEDHKVTE
jgi:hypothetical protein